MNQGLDWRTSFLRRVQHFIDEIQDPQFPRQELTPDAQACLDGPATDILIAAVLDYAGQIGARKPLYAKFGQETIRNWESLYGKRYRSIGFNDLVQQGQVELDAWNRRHGVSEDADPDDVWPARAARNSDFMGRRIRPTTPPPRDAANDRRERPASPRASKTDDKADNRMNDAPPRGDAPGRQSSAPGRDGRRAGLWLVYIENEKENFSLFVTAETPRRAGEIWADHYGFQLENMPSNQLSSLKAARVPDAARIGAETAYDWRDDGPGCVEVISPRATRVDNSPSM